MSPQEGEDGRFREPLLELLEGPSSLVGQQRPAVGPLGTRHDNQRSGHFSINLDEPAVEITNPENPPQVLFKPRAGRLFKHPDAHFLDLELPPVDSVAQMPHLLLEQVAFLGHQGDARVPKGPKNLAEVV